MPRSIKSASGGSTFVSPVTVRQGGLGTTNAADALLALNGISANQLGAPHGIAKLNSGGLPDSFLFAGLSLSESCVDGPAIILTGTSEDYFLTTYDSFQSYEVVALTGTVSRDKNVITYTAPSTMGEGGFTVNGRTITVMAVDGVTPLLVVPSVTSPVNGSELPGQTVVTTSSAFTIINGTDTHVSTDWQVSTSASFDTIAFSSLNDTINLTSWTVTGMLLGTQYYVRVRHKGLATGLSNWSTTVSFTTKAFTYPTAEVQIIKEPIQNYRSNFSKSVCLSANGKTALITTYSWALSAKAGFGYVYVYQSGTWIYQATLTCTGIADDRVGFSSSMSDDGNTVLITALDGNSKYEEAAYVFTRTGTTWTKQTKLLAGDPATGDGFGRSSAMSSDGNTVLIGALHKTGLGGTNEGAAYVFTRSGTTWTQQAKLLTGDQIQGGTFGASVALSSDGSTALISATNTTESGIKGAGSVFAFTRTGVTWTRQAKIQPNDPSLTSSFGVVVKLSSDGNTAAIAATGKTVTQSKQGAAYVFTRTGVVWTQQARLLADDPAVNDFFGNNLSLSGDGNTLITGIMTKTVTKINQGQVYVFERSGANWTLRTKWIASDAAQPYSKGFGSAVAVSRDGSVVFVGSKDNDTSGNISASGCCYVFS